MPKFAANLSMMFNEYDFCDRFEQAALCGFKAVEFASPYEIKRDLLKNILKETHLKLVLFNTRCGDDQHGFWGNTAVPGCEDKALDDFKIALDYMLVHLSVKRFMFLQAMSKQERILIYIKLL